MKLKFYLRGLGIGIAVTAGILMLAGVGNKTMTDEEIIDRAKELGLVENKVLAELNKDTSEQEGQEADDSSEDTESDTEELTSETVDESTENDSENVSSDSELSEQEPSEQEPSEQENSEQETSEQQSSEQEPSEQTPDSEEVIEEFVIVTVVGGDSSVAVSQKVYNAGLVESAASFDAFLCANGYDKILAVGNHEIPVGATMKEIADVLVKKTR